MSAPRVWFPVARPDESAVIRRLFRRACSLGDFRRDTAPLYSEQDRALRLGGDRQRRGTNAYALGAEPHFYRAGRSGCKRAIAALVVAQREIGAGGSFEFEAGHAQRGTAVIGERDDSSRPCGARGLLGKFECFRRDDEMPKARRRLDEPAPRLRQEERSDRDQDRKSPGDPPRRGDCPATVRPERRPRHRIGLPRATRSTIPIRVRQFRHCPASPR